MNQYNKVITTRENGWLVHRLYAVSLQRHLKTLAELRSGRAILLD